MPEGPALEHDAYQEGSRWFHIWFDKVPGSDLITCAIQVETIGVKITAAPYVFVSSTECRKLLDLFSQLPGIRIDDLKISVRID